MSNPLRSWAEERAGSDVITVRMKAPSEINANAPEWRPVVTAPTTERSRYVGYGGGHAWLVIPDFELSESIWNPIARAAEEPNWLAASTVSTCSAWTFDPSDYLKLASEYFLGADTTPRTSPTTSRQDVLVERLKSELSLGGRENTDVDDPVASFLEMACDEYGAIAVEAVAQILKEFSDSMDVRERLIRALGFVRNGSAVQVASDLLVEALRDSEAQIRDAAVSAMAFGADAERSSNELRTAAQVESVALLRAAMLQTAEQLEVWGRRRAFTAKDRTKEVAR